MATLRLPRWIQGWLLRRWLQQCLLRRWQLRWLHCRYRTGLLEWPVAAVPGGVSANGRTSQSTCPNLRKSSGHYSPSNRPAATAVATTSSTAATAAATTATPTTKAATATRIGPAPEYVSSECDFAKSWTKGGRRNVLLFH